MGTTKDVREAGEAEPGFGPLAGPADTGVTTVGVQVALTGVDAGGACRRLMSAGPAPDAAGHRDGPDPVAAARRPWLTRNVAVLCGVSFLQDTASELLYPILPVFLTAVHGTPVAVVGIAEGAADGATALAKVAAGIRVSALTGVSVVLAQKPTDMADLR